MVESDCCYPSTGEDGECAHEDGDSVGFAALLFCWGWIGVGCADGVQVAVQRYGEREG